MSEWNECRRLETERTIEAQSHITRMTRIAQRKLTFRADPSHVDGMPILVKPLLLVGSMISPRILGLFGLAQNGSNLPSGNQHPYPMPILLPVSIHYFPCWFPSAVYLLVYGLRSFEHGHHTHGHTIRSQIPGQ